MPTFDLAVPAPPAITGASAAIRRARALLDMPGDGPLLILADEGLEPEAIARYVHQRERGAHPFVRVDCAQPGAETIEHLLFDVRSRTSGDLETLGPGSALIAAGRGTLFLDGIGELPAAQQRRLARLLRDREARTRARDRVQIEARVVASAPPSLPGDAKEGRFRADLLRRFGAVLVSVPGLHERPEDIEAIVRCVAAEVSVACGRKAPAFTPAALTMLAAMPWTRNVEELRDTMTRVLRDLNGDLVRQEDLLPAASLDGLVRRIRPGVSLREARRRFEREYIASVLEQHGWRMSDAARTLGIERANLYRKARELGIQRARGARQS